MACSTCGRDGHNMTTCARRRPAERRPSRSQEADQGRNFEVYARVDRLTKGQMERLARAIVDAKQRYGDGGRGTIVKGQMGRAIEGPKGRRSLTRRDDE